MQSIIFFHTVCFLRNVKLSYTFWPCSLQWLCFLTQIKVYSEFGGKPHTWDKSQRGTVKIGFDDSDDGNSNDEHDTKSFLRFMWWSVNEEQFRRHSLAEYAAMSISLALVIVWLFPAAHRQIASTITSVRHQSVYWGTYTAYNFFSGKFVTMRYAAIHLHREDYVLYTAISVQVFTYLILIFASLVYSF